MYIRVDKFTIPFRKTLKLFRVFKKDPWGLNKARRGMDQSFPWHGSKLGRTGLISPSVVQQRSPWSGTKALRVFRRARDLQIFTKHLFSKSKAVSQTTCIFVEPDGLKNNGSPEL